MIIDANVYFAHFFFLNKNMYIFIWGESSIKMSEPGEYYHTHRHTDTHTQACIRLHVQKRHSELFARETNSHKWPSKTHAHSGKLKPSLLGRRGPDPL